MPLAHVDGCAVECTGVSGAYHVEGDVEDQVAAALGTAFDGMRTCVGEEGMRPHRLPTMTLRFGAQGDLTFVGVDTAEDSSATACLNDAANRTVLGVAVAGRAVLRCNERCVREPSSRKGRHR